MHIILNKQAKRKEGWKGVVRRAAHHQQDSQSTDLRSNQPNPSFLPDQIRLLLPLSYLCPYEKRREEKREIISKAPPPSIATADGTINPTSHRDYIRIPLKSFLYSRPNARAASSRKSLFFARPPPPAKVRKESGRCSDSSSFS